MNLQDIIQAMQQLESNQLQQLRGYLDEMESHSTAQASEMLDMDALRAAVAKMREGLSENDIDEIAQAMECFCVKTH